MILRNGIDGQFESQFQTIKYDTCMFVGYNGKTTLLK